MPNHVTNRLQISKKSPELDKILEFMSKKEDVESGDPLYIDFNAIVPIAPELTQVKSGPGSRIAKMIVSAEEQNSDSARMRANEAFELETEEVKACILALLEKEIK